MADSNSVTPALATLGASGWQVPPGNPYQNNPSIGPVADIATLNSSNPATSSSGRIAQVGSAPPYAQKISDGYNWQDIPRGKIRNAAKIKTMLAAIGRAGYERVNLGWHGHSIVQGVGSDDTTTQGVWTNARVWRDQSMATVAGRRLNAAMGGSFSAGVESFVYSQSGFATLGGGAAVSSQYGASGPGGYAVLLGNATQTLQFAAIGTSVKIYGYTSVTGLQIQYKINGGTATNASTVSSSNTTGFGTRYWYDIVITGLTPGDTVQIIGSASAAYGIYLVDPDYKTTAGITMHRLAMSGGLAGQVVAGFLDATDTQPAPTTWNDATNGPGYRTMQTNTVSSQLGLAGVFCTFDCNDVRAYNSSGTSYGWTLADHQRHITNYLAAMSSRNIPVLFVCCQVRDPSNPSVGTGTPYTQQDIINAYRDLSDASTNAAFIDLTDEWAGADLATRYAAQQASGLLVDSIHPGKNLHSYLGQRSANAVLQSVGSA